MDEQVELSAEDVAAITEANAEIERGECENFRDFATRMRKKFCGAECPTDSDQK